MIEHQLPVAHVGERLWSTQRKDRWWAEPLAIAAGLLLFTVYATWAAFAGTNYSSGPYLSPFYSPLIMLPGRGISPALVVLWAPLGFRLTCYYYRKAYYRAFFLSPPACAVSEIPHDYRGEAGILRWFPILHRWFLYISVAVLAVLWYDALRAFIFDGRFGVGIGTVLLVANAVFLTFFTFGCHALRSLAGGNRRCMSCSSLGNVQYRGWRVITRLNRKHGMWAWISLYSVAFADLYVRLLAMGIFHDPRIVF